MAHYICALGVARFLSCSHWVLQALRLKLFSNKEHMRFSLSVIDRMTSENAAAVIAERVTHNKGNPLFMNSLTATPPYMNHYMCTQHMQVVEQKQSMEGLLRALIETLQYFSQTSPTPTFDSMHNGHVTNNNEKMSKSLGNFFNIGQIT
ncbi:cysteine--tRNA ligase 2, cytoplasmic-like [Senna tora]|uniref:Cysteine--tRNA ligase 2, cytoplasmic-like n=1 Tax=Senna tora TaxID=362788 RepID=A0A834XDC2_9FABA|nr:cysteine--tRNA ligase 2, cytoplasmic-like [Senna tora]